MDTVLSAAFESKRMAVGRALTASGFTQKALELLPHRQVLNILDNKVFQFSDRTHKAAFALQIGSFSGTVWACSDGLVIRDTDYLRHTSAVEVTKGDVIHTSMKLEDSIIWLPKMRAHLFSPLEPRTLALVHCTIMRWAVGQKPFTLSKVIFPDHRALIDAFRFVFPEADTSKSGSTPAKPSQGTVAVQKLLKATQAASQTLAQPEEEHIDHQRSNNTNEQELASSTPALAGNDGSMSSSEDARTPISSQAPANPLGPVKYASTASILDALGNDAQENLPTLDNFKLSSQNVEDYLPLRLRIGACYNKRGVLCHLWVYFKVVGATTKAPAMELYAHLPFDVDPDRRPTDVSEESDPEFITFEDLMIKTNFTSSMPMDAELFDIFRVPETKDEFRALAKWVFIQAAESPTLNLEHHRIPHNPSFEAKLQALCMSFSAWNVLREDPYYENISLPLRRREAGGLRQSQTSKSAAYYAESANLEALGDDFEEEEIAVSRPRQRRRTSTRSLQPAASPTVDRGRLHSSPGDRESGADVEANGAADLDARIASDNAFIDDESDFVSPDASRDAPTLSPSPQDQQRRAPPHGRRTRPSTGSTRSRAGTSSASTPVSPRPKMRKQDKIGMKAELEKLREQRKVLSGRVTKDRASYKRARSEMRDVQAALNSAIHKTLQAEKKMSSSIQKLVAADEETQAFLEHCISEVGSHEDSE